MIAYIKGVAGKKAMKGYLALHRLIVGRFEGDWVPVTGKPVSSSKLAVQECVTGLGWQLDDLEDLVSNRIQAAKAHLARLSDRPGKTERVRIHGEICKVGKDGAVVLPKKPERKGPFRPYSNVEIEEPVYQTLKRAMKLGRQSREGAVQLMVDCAINETPALLAAVAEIEPAMLGQVASFMAGIYRNRRTDPLPLGNGNGDDNELSGS